MFTSAALEVNRHEFEDSQYQARESHADELTSLLGGGDYSPQIRMDSPPSSSIVNQRRPQPMPGPEQEQPTVELPVKTPGKTTSFISKS